MRFDMRAPAIGAPAADLYEAALEMAAWADGRGALAAILCEHHGMSDGYLPSPLVLAAAMAARTTTLPIMVAAVVLPLYHPVRLAEDMVVIDILSRGRVSYVAAIGYRPEEYEMHDVDFHRRGAIAEEHLGVLLAAKSGAPFEFAGRTVRVTPTPFTPGGPPVAWGGGSVAAARRAGRHGLGFLAQRSDPALEPAFREAEAAHGHEPGMCLLPDDDTTTALFVAEDVDLAWEELGPYLMHDVTMYAALNEGAPHSASISSATTADELRAEDTSHRIVTVDEAVDLVRGGTPLQLHPLIGGLPPEVGWRYLRTVVDRVVPATVAG